MIHRMKLVILLFLSVCAISPAQAYDIKILVNYTNTALQRYPTTDGSSVNIYTPQNQYSHSVPSGIHNRIMSLFNDANYTFYVSGVNINLVPVGFVNINLDPATATLVPDINAYVKDINFSQEYQINEALDREKFQSDLMTMFTISSPNICGNGTTPAKALDRNNNTTYIDGKSWTNSSNNIIGIDCNSGNVLAHEIGHNLGLNHSLIKGDKGSIYDYGVGFGEVGLFNTVMAYGKHYNSTLWMYAFSNPNLICYSPFACGKANIADSSRALNNIAYAASQLNERCRKPIKFDAAANSWYKAPTTCTPTRFKVNANYVQ